MVVLTAVGVPLCAWLGTRAVNSLDSARADISDIRLTMRGIQGQYDILNIRINEVERRTQERINDVDRHMNERATAISGWAQRNTDAIDRIRENMLRREPK